VTDNSEIRQAETTSEEPKVEAAAIVRGVSKKFGETVVLEDITFEVAEGEAMVLLGASGSGKTTILRIIAGLEEPDGGQVILHGRDVTALPARERGVGVIFQDYALFPKMTVERNIGYGLRIRHRPRREIKETVDRLLALINLEDHRGKYPSQLSGGQRQRVAIARTLAYQPEVLLFDEPFGALDANTRLRLRREIRSLLKEVNVPAIFITHDQEEALEIGDRIAVLNTGRIEQVGAPDEVYNRPATEYVASFLGAANLLLGVVYRGAVEIGSATIDARGETKRFRDGQSVKLVFRPEDVCLSKTGALPDNCRRLGYGIVEEARFGGGYERLVVRLNMKITSEVEPEASTTAPPHPEGHSGAPIIVTRPKLEAQNLPLEAGDRVVVGLTALRVLPNYTLTSELASRRVDVLT
jgi:ABC-type Fe3+/spermidine/putrescine transport system ATPase subunit